MKIERVEPEFKPVVITLESRQDLVDLQDMVEYAYNQCDFQSNMDSITRVFRELLKGL